MTREEFEELLPWYATGTLDPEETRSVEAHLASSPDARQELARFQVLHAVVQDTSGEPEWNPGLVNDALQRIDVYERERAGGAATARGGLAAWLRRTFVPTWEATPSLARAALVAQLALLLAVGAALLVPGERGGYQTVGGSQASDHARLSVGFAAQATEPQLRALLRELDATLVGGPSALGLYTVELEAEPDDDAAIEAALARLRETPHVVRYAEKLE